MNTCALPPAPRVNVALVEAAQAHARYMDEVIRPRITPEALALVRSHQHAGDTVMIVTATNEFVTRPIAQAFGVSELIAVDLERDASGWITGEIRGTPSFREGKVTRVAHWLEPKRLGLGRRGNDVLLGLHERLAASGKSPPSGGNEP